MNLVNSFHPHFGNMKLDLMTSVLKIAKDISLSWQKMKGYEIQYFQDFIAFIFDKNKILIDLFGEGHKIVAGVEMTAFIFIVDDFGKQTMCSHSHKTSYPCKKQRVALLVQLLADDKHITTAHSFHIF